MKKYNVAVVGATGAVGEAIFDILQEREFPVDNIYALASERSEGKKVMLGSKAITVTDLANFDFKLADIALFSAGGAISAEFAPKAGDSDCVVIDNTSHFRYDDDIPLIVPEVNSNTLEEFFQQLYRLKQHNLSLFLA